MAGPLKLTRTHRILVGLVVTGAVIIAGIGFAGSYSAVRALAERKGFGQFSLVFPIGIDAGICVLLALDLLLTWIRIPFPLLRQTAWLLTAATIAFNGAAAWPDPLGTGMHAVIPVLFVVAVEAARHAVGRIADITADKHMEGVRLTRWMLSPLPTFLLWRRMKLWELRSYDQTIRLEQERLIYQARLRSRYGRAWRRKAPIESLMPLRLARYGVPLAETAPAGLAAAGIEPALLPASPSAKAALERTAVVGHRPAERPAERDDDWARPPDDHDHDQAEPPPPPDPQDERNPWFAAAPHHQTYEGGYNPSYAPAEQYEQWYAQQDPTRQQGPGPGLREPIPAAADGAGPQGGAPVPFPQDEPEPALPNGPVRVPAGPGRTRPLGGNNAPIPGPRPEPHPMQQETQQFEQLDQPEAPGAGADEMQATRLPDDVSRDEAFYRAFRMYVNERMDFPNARQFGLYLQDLYGVTGQSGGPLVESTLRPYLRDFRARYQQELDADAEHIA